MIPQTGSITTSLGCNADQRRKGNWLANFDIDIRSENHHLVLTEKQVVNKDEREHSWSENLSGIELDCNVHPMLGVGNIIFQDPFRYGTDEDN